MEYVKDQIISFAGKQYKVTATYKNSFVGQPCYDLESIRPDEKGLFTTHKRILESMINKTNEKAFY